MSRLARWYLLLRGWRFVGSPPEEPKAVIVAAPHTSNWDFLVFRAVARHFRLSVGFLGKDSLFRGPLGVLMRRWGGIPVDRSRPRAMVDSVSRYFDTHDEVLLVITPEGTRGKARVWKSGFWRIADALDLPVYMGFVDAATKTTGFGPVRKISGDPHGWMDAARKFYAGMEGINRLQRGPMILQSETPG
ncbi:MAG: 1-acyl-sn-glycerol-3-phosphate acyltransferase [Acidimicrobiia bacterium]